MKKLLIGVGILLVMVVVVGVAGLTLFFDRAVKYGVETVGLQLTRAPIRLDGVTLSPLTGSGSIRGLQVGNPDGYRETNAIRLDRASLSLNPLSLLTEKIVIRSIRIEGPVFNIEGSPTVNNLTRIHDNIRTALGIGAAAGAGAEGAAAAPGRRLQVDEFILTGGKVNYTVPGVGITVPIAVPDIKMTGLGAGPEGITAGDLAQRVLGQLHNDLVPLLAKAAAETATGTVDTVTEEAGRVLRGVGELLR